MNLTEPEATPFWSGWRTIDGLKSAAASREYSLVK